MGSVDAKALYQATLTMGGQKRCSTVGARIGWIHPRANSDVEVYGFYQVAPKRVVVVVTTLEVIDSASKEERGQVNK
jgi:hypothetical protein